MAHEHQTDRLEKALAVRIRSETDLVRALVHVRRELAASEYAAQCSLDAFGKKWPDDAREIVRLMAEPIAALVAEIDRALEPHAAVALAVSERPIPLAEEKTS